MAGKLNKIKMDTTGARPFDGDQAVRYKERTLRIYHDNIELDAVFDKLSLTMKFTAVFQKVPHGYVGFVEELPGANTQGEDLDETRKNLAEAVELILDANRQLAEESITGQSVIREPFLISAS